MNRKQWEQRFAADLSMALNLLPADVHVAEMRQGGEYIVVDLPRHPLSSTTTAESTTEIAAEKGVLTTAAMLSSLVSTPACSANGTVPAGAWLADLH